jgi:undecaprenyl-phosphate 4-deoxy-4-formamido-L-arabinose transferase
VDWSLKDKDATDIIATFRQHLPQMPVLVLSMHEELFYAERALRVGADGYIMKQEATEKIIEAVRTVIAGHPFLSSRMAQATNGETREWAEGRHAAHPVPDAIAHAAERAMPARPPPGPHQAALRLSIVIPVYNSETTIGKLCDQLIRELSPFYQMQVVLVDDNSSDRSAETCQKLHERYPERVDCLVLSRNFGEHNAVMAGLNCADGDYCVIMDDDFQNPPSEVRKLVTEIAHGHDVVYVRYESKRHSPYRNLGSRMHNWMATRALGKPADLYLSSFKVISRFLMQEIVRYTGPDPYIDAIILRTTRKIGVITSRHEPRHGGKSGYTFRKLVALWGNMIVSFSLFPLRLLGALGAIMLLLGTGFGIITFAALLVPGWQDPDSLERLNAINWFFRGITLVAVGIVGEYVGRIYMHLNRDPQFIIRSITRHRL